MSDCPGDRGREWVDGQSAVSRQYPTRVLLCQVARVGQGASLAPNTWRGRRRPDQREEPRTGGIRPRLVAQSPRSDDTTMTASIDAGARDRLGAAFAAEERRGLMLA